MANQVPEELVKDLWRFLLLFILLKIHLAAQV
jgi:hypothetical protein